VSDRPHVSYVICAFNEELRLPASLDRVIAFLSQQPFESEVIVSDDGSTDDTPQIVARRARALEDSDGRVMLRLLRSERNGGKGAAIRRGMLDAQGSYVFFMDADLAAGPEDSPQLLAQLEGGGADVAIGTRVQRDGTDMRASQPLQRRFAGKAYTWLRKAMRVLPDIEDTQCPLKGFRIDVAKAIFSEQCLSGWIFDAEVLYIARSKGYQIVALPVRWRHVEGSRLRVRPSQAWQVVRDLVRLRFIHRPRR
jgi:dolichyl-phosphate beta-glucosyltransferase